MAACLLSLLVLSCSKSSPSPPQAQDGVLDLRSWNFEHYGSVPLAGTWEFYSGALLDEDSLSDAPAPTLRRVPDLWKDRDAGEGAGRGAGTYRLRVLLPPEPVTLAIRYRTVSTAFELDANGRRLATVGRPSVTAAEAVPTFLPGIVSLPTGSSTVDLLVRVSNHEYRQGGLWRSFILGTSEKIEMDKRVADDMVLVLAAAIFIMAVNSFLIFLFRKQELAYLYFTLFALSLFLRLWVTGEYLLAAAIPGIPFDLVVRLEYLSVTLPIPLFTLFLAKLFPEEAKRRLVVAICLPFALQLIFGIPFEPLSILSWTVFPFYGAAFLSGIALLLGILLPAIRHRREGATAILFGGLVLAAAVVNDILYTSFLLNTGNSIGVGFVIFILVQSGVLGRRFSRAFDRSEILQKELSVMNDRLAEENRRYQITQDELQATLAEKELLLREVHHRVKNSLQIVSSSLGLQAHRTTDPAVLEVYSMARNRIRAISLVHEKLYGLRSAEYLDVVGYARDLVDHLAGNFGGDSREVSISVDSPPGTLDADIDDCVDFGLVLTELVVNAVKHGPLNGRRLGVIVGLNADGDVLVLRVEDDGPGFPEGFDPATVSTLGFRIVGGLVRKHEGSLAIRPGPGGRVEVRLAILGDNRATVASKQNANIASEEKE